MAHRFRFNYKNKESVEVEGARVDLDGGRITVVDEQGHPVVSFAETELSAWFRVIGDSAPSS